MQVKIIPRQDQQDVTQHTELEKMLSVFDYWGLVQWNSVARRQTVYQGLCYKVYRQCESNNQYFGKNTQNKEKDRKIGSTATLQLFSLLQTFSYSKSRTLVSKDTNCNQQMKYKKKC
jgi:hypothetical protein